MLLRNNNARLRCPFIPRQPAHDIAVPDTGFIIIQTTGSEFEIKV